jgi:hypothetical protein
MTAVWLFLRAEARRRWRAWLSLALIVGVFAGGVVTATAGAVRTGSAYVRFLDWSRAPDALVAAEPYTSSFARLSPAAVMRVPQAADAAVIKTLLPYRSMVSFMSPASKAIPGQFWKRKILSGRLADPARPDEVNVSFALPQVLGLGLAAVALLTIAHLLITSVRRRRRDFAILRALGFTSWQVRGTLCWQALALAGMALVIGVPAGIACGRISWQVFAHQLGITPVVAVPLAVLAVMAAGWLAAAAVIAVLPGEAATRNPPARALRSE